MIDASTRKCHMKPEIEFDRGRSAPLRSATASFSPRGDERGGEPVLETFVFDFSGDLYDEEVLVAFYGFIRPELKFDSVEALVARMDQDSIDARAMLERTPSGELDRELYATGVGPATTP